MTYFASVQSIAILLALLNWNGLGGVSCSSMKLSISESDSVFGGFLREKDEFFSHILV